MLQIAHNVTSSYLKGSWREQVPDEFFIIEIFCQNKISAKMVGLTFADTGVNQ